jgi:hypothetical protein
VTAAAIRHEPALRFWLRYTEREGGLVEDAGDHALVLLPDELREASELPEELSVTSDPDVAREDGAMLLIPGHPALDQAARAVLAEGDAGSVYLPWPASRRPSRGTLEARARELVAVAHGRIDAAGEIAAAYLPLLRVGAMVSYAASLTLRFQEQEEAWVDARSGLVVAERVLETLAGLPHLRAPDARQRILPSDLPLALRGAHEQLEQRAQARRDTLRTKARRGLESEFARADAYYKGVLDSIDRRRASAPPDRLPLLDAQADATRAEHARRRREIEEEFDATYELRPFRLHRVHVPAYVLPVHVRRGRRTFPFELVWIAGAGEFAAICCPACGGADELVAGRERVGCAACTAGAPAHRGQPEARPEEGLRRADQPPAGAVEEARGQLAPRPPAGTVEEARRPLAPQPPGAADGPARPRPPRRVRPRPGRDAGPPRASGSGSRAGPAKAGPRKLERTGNKLAFAFWQTVADDGRWPRKKVAAHSPLAALLRLYGQAGPVCALGIRPRQWPSEVTAVTYPTGPGVPELTVGELKVLGRSYRYTLGWWLEVGRPVVAEVMPAPDPLVLALPGHGSVETEARLHERAPAPLIDLDPVAAALWKTELADTGLPFAVRCLATWWRLREAAAPNEAPPALAAAVAAAVGRAAGTRRKRAEIAASYGTSPDALDQTARALGTHLRLDRARGW